MKKLLILLLSVLFITNLNAQENFDFLIGKSVIAEFDYSSAKIDKLDAEDFFLEENRSNPNFEYLYKKRMLDIFIENCNNKVDKWCMLYKEKENAEYKMIVKILRIDDDGAHHADIVITKINSNEVLAKFHVGTNGGKWNTFFNLSAEYVEKLGDKTGIYIKRRITQ